MAVESDDTDLVLLTRLFASAHGGEERVLVDELGDFDAGDGLRVEISPNFLYISLDAGPLRGRMEVPLAHLLGLLGEMKGDA